MPLMELTVDEQGRLTCRELFPPMSRFEAKADVSGRIVLTRLTDEGGQAKVVRPIAYKGFWIIPGEVDAEKLAQELREEREQRDADLLG